MFNLTYNNNSFIVIYIYNYIIYLKIKWFNCILNFLTKLNYAYLTFLSLLKVKK